MNNHIDIGLITCSAYPDLQKDYLLLQTELSNRGHVVKSIIWNDNTVDFSNITNLIFCSVWDYHSHYDSFNNWLDQTEKLSNIINKPEIVRWNIDKYYLKHFEQNDIPVIPTLWLDTSTDHYCLDKLNWRDVVIKPAIGAGSSGMKRFNLDTEKEGALNHIESLSLKSKVMVQPYLKSADIRGETALIYFNGNFSHCVSRPMAGHQAAPDREVEEASYVEPTKKQLNIGEAVINSLPFTPAYIRVDLLEDERQEDLVLEVEMVEPTLFLCKAPQSAILYANALESDWLIGH